MGEKSFKKYSIAAYLDYEKESDIKNEYQAGEIVAMAGGTLNHGIIGNNINSEINNALKTKGLECISINGDVKIFIEKADAYVYPDGMVVYGGIESDKNDKNSIINPILVIEVLSKSTESYDRGEKFRKYCSLHSFCEYILIDQYKPIIDTLYKADRAFWKMVTTIGLNKSIYLHSIDMHIPMQDIYRNTIGLDNPQFNLDF